MICLLCRSKLNNFGNALQLFLFMVFMVLSNKNRKKRKERKHQIEFLCGNLRNTLERNKVTWDSQLKKIQDFFYFLRTNP